MNATRAISAIFFVAAAALVLAACGAAGPKPGTPEALYVDLGCATCHGENREGLRSGPPLVKLVDHWNEAELLDYLKNPKDFVQSNPRLSYLDEQYPIAMPGYADTPEEDLRKLADFILNS
jgi:cytochrome c553